MIMETTMTKTGMVDDVFDIQIMDYNTKYDISIAMILNLITSSAGPMVDSPLLAEIPFFFRFLLLNLRCLLSHLIEICITLLHRSYLDEFESSLINQ